MRCRLFDAANEPKRLITFDSPAEDGFGGHVDALFEHLDELKAALADELPQLAPPRAFMKGHKVWMPVLALLLAAAAILGWWHTKPPSASDRQARRRHDVRRTGRSEHLRHGIAAGPARRRPPRSNR